MRYYLIAGEASGDLHGANLMKALLKYDEQADFRFFGGEKMAAVGGCLVKHYKEMAFMGFVEVLANLQTVLANLKKCKADVLDFRPDVLVLIDFPGFNLKIAEYAKKQGIKVCYYISPKVWAWNQKRVLKIKKVVDQLYCILPFEVDFYQKWGMQVHYVGNPLLDEIARFEADPTFREKNGLQDQKIVALLPGSRKQEIERLLPEMLAVAKHFAGYHFVVAAAPNFEEAYYRSFGMPDNVSLVFGQTYQLLAQAQLAIVASGTATLETALFAVPQVVVYKGGALTIAIGRMLIKIKFISLVNLILDRALVTELIQADCNLARLLAELGKLKEGQYRQAMLQGYSELKKLMGNAGASERTAQHIYQYARS